MKKIITVVSLLTLSGCAGMSQYQQECNAIYKKFESFYMCVEEKLLADPRANFPANRDGITSIQMLGNVLIEQVDTKKMTDAEAKLVFDQKRNEIKNASLQQRNTQALIGAIGKPNYPQNSSCTALGNTVNCRSY